MTGKEISDLGVQRVDYHAIASVGYSDGEGGKAEV